MARNRQFKAFTVAKEMSDFAKAKPLKDESVAGESYGKQFKTMMQEYKRSHPTGAVQLEWFLELMRAGKKRGKGVWVA
jgi:hypothetical protein